MNLQEYYDTIMQLSHGIVVTLDLDGVIIHGNSMLESLSGYSMQELAGKDWFETFIPAEQRADSRKEVLDKAGKKDISRISGSIRSRGGDKIYIDWNLKALTDSDSSTISILCVGQNVTEHMRRQNGLLRERFNLIERNKELNCLYEISKLGADGDLDLKETLRKIVNMLPSGFQNPDKTHVRLRIGNLCWETEGYHKTENVLVEPIESGADIRGSVTVSVEYAGPKRKGESVFLDDENELLVTTAQQIGLIVGKKEIKTARQELEQQLRQADRLAKIGQFSAGVAHEINEPLANILGYAQLALQTPELPEQVRMDLDNIVDSSLHAREIIKKIMFFSRQLPPQFIPTNLNQTIRDALRITETAAKRGNIETRCEFDEKLPLVSADPRHIKQVIVNLAANAIQAMDDGGVLTIKTLSDGDDVYIIVDDNGPGIHADDLKQIFNPFFTTKDVDKGTGLGLSVVLGIVKAHKGLIQVHSDYGQGTRFEIAIPCLQNNQSVE
ncbi:ATP-binding protein [Maridesulfovibrio sp.]|uniref:PAS domain-containing sensor histidine kinase n=1 Tax=Maridesulfovibrio sp. TaxID=2795000 RepID=UPI002A18AFA0|nr:ATP-binding protein [Maridesulfovibrio sp.]